jgi:hypothetical protein
MWTDEKQQRFDQLRQREAQGLLTEAEAEELRTLVAELDAEETAELQPAIERMRATQQELRAESQRIEGRNERLAAIIAREEQLLDEAQAYLNHLRTEQTILSEEYRAITGRQVHPTR